MSQQDVRGSKSLSASVRSLDTSRSATVRPTAAVGQSTVVSPKTMQPISIVLQNPMAQAQTPVVQNSMVQNALGTPQRPVLQPSKTVTAPLTNNPDVFHAIERRLQVFKCEILSEIQSSLNNYAPLALHKTSQDITAASHNELKSLLGSERQMRDVSIQAVREVHVRQMQDLTINFQKEIEAAVECERKERNTQFEELVKRFCAQSICVDRKVDGEILSQESYDDVLLQESKIVETQTVMSERDEPTQQPTLEARTSTTTTTPDRISTIEFIAEHNTASDSLCESNRSINDLDNALQLLSVEYRQKVEGESAWQYETQSSQEKIRAAYSELEGAFLNLSKEFDTRLRTLSEHMMAETTECNMRLDEHHTWNAEIVRSCQELRDWVIDLKDSDNVERRTV